MFTIHPFTPPAFSLPSLPPPANAPNTVHPGWVRASAILLRGLARLEVREREAGEGQETPQKTNRPATLNTRRA